MQLLGHKPSALKAKNSTFGWTSFRVRLRLLYYTVLLTASQNKDIIKPMSEMTQLGWESHVRKVVSEWFRPTKLLGDDILASKKWTDVCGINGSILESHLCARDLMKVLTTCYHLAAVILADGDTSDAEQLCHFLEECMERLRLPRLELKHIWYADQWHDFDRQIDVFKNQDLARAQLCLRELESGEYYPGRLQWPWHTAK